MTTPQTPTEQRPKPSRDELIALALEYLSGAPESAVGATLILPSGELLYLPRPAGGRAQ